MLRIVLAPLVVLLVSLAAPPASCADETVVASKDAVDPGSFVDSDRASGFSSPVPEGATLVQSGFNGLMVVVPASKDAAIAFGKNGWNRQAIENPDGDEIIPVMSAFLVALKHDTKVYAYSPQADRWDAVTVSGSKDVQPAVGQQSIVVYDGDLLHSFAMGGGQWSTVNMKTGEVTR